MNELPDLAVGRNPDWWLTLARVAIHQARHRTITYDQLADRLNRWLYLAEHSTSGKDTR